MGVGTIESKIGNATRQIREHVAMPVYREGYALILSAGVAAVGLVYWIVAARSSRRRTSALTRHSSRPCCCSPASPSSTSPEG